MTETVPASRAAIKDERRIAGWAFIMAVLVVAVLITASWLFAQANFSSNMATSLLELAIVGIGGVLAGVFVRWITGLRSRVRVKSAQRRELLQRTRDAHVSIASAQRQLRADQSATTYSAQMNQLMNVETQLEDLEQDVVAATDLFGADNGRIVAGLSLMAGYLATGREEYTDWAARNPASVWPSLPKVDPGAWLRELISSTKMPDRYEDAVTMCKGTMRVHVYGQ